MQKTLGFWEVFSIGGGIFAVLGLSIQLAKVLAPLAFLIAGIIALITAYSYTRLSVRFPSKGGTVEFILCLCLWKLWSKFIIISPSKYSKTYFDYRRVTCCF